MKINRPFIQSLIRTITLAAMLLTTTTLLAGYPIFYNRPTDESLKTWLTGKKVTVEKGIIFDSVWTIEAKEFKEFEKLSISKGVKGIYTLHVRPFPSRRIRSGGFIGELLQCFNSLERVLAGRGEYPSRPVQLLRRLFQATGR